MNKCKYCGKDIPEVNVRCDACNDAWDAGKEHGEIKIRQDVYETLRRLQNIAGITGWR